MEKEEKKVKFIKTKETNTRFYMETDKIAVKCLKLIVTESTLVTPSTMYIPSYLANIIFP